MAKTAKVSIFTKQDGWNSIRIDENAFGVADGVIMVDTKNIVGDQLESTKISIANKEHSFVFSSIKELIDFIAKNYP